jgi:predicted RNase H-like HicB family nuclease
MTRKYSLVIEGDPSGYSAYVPELPSILVTGQSMDELTRRAEEAIRLYWDELRAERSPTATLREIEVELPA